MSYAVIESFIRGLDVRRLPETTEPGALLKLHNAHITRGGEVATRTAWVAIRDLAPETVGLYCQDGPIFHIFGTIDQAALSVPPGVNVVYHKLIPPDGTTLTRILSVDAFMQQLYVVAEFSGGQIVHYWDDVIVREPMAAPDPDDPTPPDPPDPDTPPPSVDVGRKAFVTITISPERPAAAFSGWSFIGVSQCILLFEGHSQAIYHRPAGGDMTLTNGTYLVPHTASAPQFVPFAHIEWLVDTLPQQFALAIAAEINLLTATTGVEATVSGRTLTIQAAVAGTEMNGRKLVFSGTAPALFEGFTSGVLTFDGGRYPSTSLLRRRKSPRTESLNENWRPGTFAMAAAERMWATDENYLRFSVFGQPDNWKITNNTPDQPDPLRGGFIDLSRWGTGIVELTALAEYDSYIAAFGRNTIDIWKVDPDESINQRVQALRHTGTRAPRSVLPWGEGDVMYLDNDGIRSLRARDSSRAAFASDLGNAIDALVQERIRVLGVAAQFSIGTIDPNSGRLLMQVGDMGFVLSYFPGSKVAAWSTYDFGQTTEPTVTVPRDMGFCDEGLFWRSDSKLYQLGGETRDVFDATVAEAWIPYFAAGTPATSKYFTALDLAIKGTWEAQIGLDPTNLAAAEVVARVTKTTYQLESIPINGESTHVSLRLKTMGAGEAMIGNASIHYRKQTED
jgi:hypothetical protein